MPRFYFDFCDAESVQKDPEGTEMNSVQRARDAPEHAAVCQFGQERIDGIVQP